MSLVLRCLNPRGVDTYGGLEIIPADGGLTQTCRCAFLVKPRPEGAPEETPERPVVGPRDRRAHRARVDREI